ncbi:MAG: MauE/DoxX family redox-associated membrane protein [Nitrospira sp.]
MSRLKQISRLICGIVFMTAGINHFFNAPFYVSIMPPYLPWHLALVYISGVAEIGLGGLLLFERWSRLAAWGLIALLIAVFPANVHMAMHPEQYEGVSPIALWLRLPLQGFLILWAYSYTGMDRSNENLRQLGSTA